MKDISLPDGNGSAMDRRVERPDAARRKTILRAAAALVLLAVALSLYLLLPSANSLAVDGDAIRTGEVVRAPFQDYVPLRAEAAPAQTVIVTTVSGGQVADLIASDGARVASGQPLAQLTNPALELDVASRSADIAGQLSAISGQRLSVQRNRFDSEREVADATNALNQAQEELRKKQFLLGKGIVNQAAVQPAADEVAYRRRRVAALAQGRSAEGATLADQSARIGDTAAQLRESLAMVRGSLSGLTVRAPVAGLLTGFTLQPGQMLKPGDPVGQIDSADDWKLTADVDQFYLPRVRLGQRALVTLDGGMVKAHIAKVLPQVADGRFRIELAFDGPSPAGLNRGQSVDVRLILGADRPAVVAPAGGWLDAGGSTAFVLEDGGDRAVRRPITTGRRNPDQVEVTSGLAPGERIVTTGLGPYAPYQTLIIRKE